MKIAIVGGGFTGLTTAYYLSKNGSQVTVFEKEKFLGGLASGIKVGDWYIDRFYHHIFKSDHEIQKLTLELGLKNIWLWQKGGSPIFYQGKIYPFTTPLDLLRFSPLPIFERLKTGISFLFLKSIKNYQMFENIKACDWLKKWMGQKSWQIIWKPLMQKKFGQYYDKVSMTWMWARIHKRSTYLGYPKGGFQIIIDKLSRVIKKNKGKIILDKEINNVEQLKGFDKIIFTVADPIFKKITKVSTQQLKKTPYLGTIVLLLQLKKPLTSDVYWLNINDFSCPFVALIEHTNFINKKFYQNKNFVYLGVYTAKNSELFRQKKEKVVRNWAEYLKKINKNFKLNWIEKYWVFKEPFTQPIFRLGVKRARNDFKTPLEHVYLANMAHVYPWDRGVNYAVEIGMQVALSL